MTFSDDVEAALELLAASGAALRKRQDIGVIMEAGVETNDSDAVNAIVFHGKNAWSTYSLLRKMRHGDNGFRNIENEFMTSINSLRALLADLVKTAAPDRQERMQNVYFAMTQGAIRNLIDLAHDLSAVKGLQNKSKRPLHETNEQE